MALVAEMSAPSDSSESDKLDEKLTEFCKVPALEPEQVDLNLGDPRSAHAINCYVQKKEIMVASAKGTASGGELNRLSDPDR